MGEYAAVSGDAFNGLAVSKAGRFGLGSDVSVSVPVIAEPPAPDVDSSAVVGDGSSVGEVSFFLSFSCASSPSTLLSKASSTSVFGPRFFGTASADANYELEHDRRFHRRLSIWSQVGEGFLITNHKYMGTERPDKLRRRDVSGCT